MEASQLKAIMVEALDEHYGDHASHHLWIQARIEAEEKRRDFMDGLAKTVAQWSVTALCGAAIWWVQSHWK